MLCAGEILRNKMKEFKVNDIVKIIDKDINDARLLQVEIYLHEFINLYCIRGDKETCMMSEFNTKFQNYINIMYSGVTIAKVMITKLKYHSFSKNSSRYYKGLSLENKL